MREIEDAFGPLDDRVRLGTLDVGAVIDDVVTEFKDRYPDILCVYVFGSSITGTFKPYSDVDVLIVRNNGAAKERLNVNLNGIPIEASIISIGCLPFLIAAEHNSGYTHVIRAISTGRLVHDPFGVGSKIQLKTRTTYNKGPKSLPNAAIDLTRYILTNQLAELYSNEDHHESVATAMTMYPYLMGLLGRKGCSWAYRGKWFVRMLSADEVVTYDDIAKAYAALHIGNNQPLIDLILKVLAPWGGVLWDGYRESRDYPTSPQSRTDGQRGPSGDGFWLGAAE